MRCSQLFELNYAALLGFLVGVSVIIPYLGIAVVTIPVVSVVALMQFGLSSDFLYLMLGYFVIQGLDGLLLVPLLCSAK
jgi:putative permease